MNKPWSEWHEIHFVADCCIAASSINCFCLRLGRCNEEIISQPDRRDLLIECQRHSCLVNWAFRNLDAENDCAASSNCDVTHGAREFICDIDSLEFDFPSESVTLAERLEEGRCQKRGKKEVTRFSATLRPTISAETESALSGLRRGFGLFYRIDFGGTNWAFLAPPDVDLEFSLVNLHVNLSGHLACVRRFCLVSLHRNF